MKELLSKEEKGKEEPKPNVLLVSENRPSGYQPPRVSDPLRDPFPGIGGSDLDPFGRIGSGSIFARGNRSIVHWVNIMDNAPKRQFIVSLVKLKETRVSV